MPRIPGSFTACRSTASASARLILSSAPASRAAPIESPFDSPSILLRHASLCACSPLAISQIPAPGTTLAETSLLEVCSAKVGPRHTVLHQHFSWVSGHHLSGSLQSNLDVGRKVTAIWGPEWLAFREFCPASHLSDSAILLTFAESVLIASPCSVTTTASDNGFSMPTNTPGMEPRLPLSSSRWFGGHVQDLLSKLCCPFARVVFAAVSFLAMSHLFIRSAAHSTSQHSILASGVNLVPVRCSSAAFSVLTFFQSKRNEKVSAVS